MRRLCLPLLLALSCGNQPAAPQPEAPTPSTLVASVLPGGPVMLSWTQCPDTGFESYTLWRSDSPGIPGNPSQAHSLFTGTGRYMLTFTDSTAAPGSSVHYALETRNQQGYKAWSNEVMVAVPDPEPRLTVFFIDPTWGSLSGDAMLVRTPGGRNYLVDGGSSIPEWSCGTDVILPLLDSLGIDHLDGIVATHPHSDHIGGLLDVFGMVTVGTVWDCGWPGPSSSLYQQFLDAAAGSGAQLVVARRGMTLDWGPGLNVRVLHPTGDLGSGSMNNASIVLRITFGQVGFLLAGDLETLGGEESVLAAFSPQDLRAQVLKVGHHGSHDATGAAWLQAVQPLYGAIEAGAGNPYGHPHQELLQRLAEAGVTVFRTDVHGTFRIETDGQSLQVFP